MIISRNDTYKTQDRLGRIDKTHNNDTIENESVDTNDINKNEIVRENDNSTNNKA